MGRPPAPPSPAAGPTPDPCEPAVSRVLWAPRELPDPGPDVAGDLPAYRAWHARREEERLHLRHRGGPAPHLPADLLMVVDDPDPRLLAAGLATLAAQTTDRWHLHVATIRLSEEAATSLDRGLLLFPHSRVSTSHLPEGTGEAEAMSHLFETSTAPVLLLLDQHGRLAPDGVELLAAALGADPADGPAAAYADDDRLGEDGELVQPRLKPDWSPELLLSWPYLGRPLALRRRAVVEAGGIRPLDGGDWEHDLVLRVTEGAAPVAHVAEVLCHRGPTTPPATDGDEAVTAALERRGEDAIVVPGPLRGTFRLLRRSPRRPRVTAVVPFRDTPTLLRTCVDSVRATTGDVDLHLILVDNGSEEPETFTLLDRYHGLPWVTIRHDPRPFNWAALNNAAVTDTDGGSGTGGGGGGGGGGEDADVLVFLNNDIEAVHPGWLSSLSAQALRPTVGAVGARLMYPSRRLQHAGVVLGMTGAAGHVLCGLGDGLPGYLGMAVLTRDCSAVTGACLATRREVFDLLGGFDESLGLDLNDIDYCLRAREQGLRVIYEPQAELVHHESPSRGTSGSPKDQACFLARWEEVVLAGDPFLSRHLTRLDCSAALREPDQERKWQEWRSNLTRP